MPDIRDLINNSGYTRHRICYEMAITERALAYWESGEKTMAIGKVTHFARICGVSVGDVVKAISETVGQE